MPAELIETSLTYAEEEIKDVMRQVFANHLGIQHAASAEVTINIDIGDEGSSYPKDPMDYSDYRPAKISSITVTQK